MKGDESYRQIVKSTGIIGGAQVIVILIGLLRTKVLAVILGPLGYGISSMLTSTTDLMRQFTGLGLNFSAVREISQSSVDEDGMTIGRTITVLKRWALYTGSLGFALTAALCVSLSRYAFGNADYALSIALVSVVLLITSLSAAQGAVLQGLRQLKKMALSSIIGAALGTAIVIPLYMNYGNEAIVPAIIVSALVSLGVSWWFTRKIAVICPAMTVGQTIRSGLAMARLGFFLTVTSLIVTLIMYAMRALIVRKLDLAAAGNFHAVWTISNSYIGIVLSAMGADFFPRLSAIHKDDSASNTLINQQMEIGLLIISPLLIALSSGAELVMHVFYSSKFDPAAPLLQWQLFGAFFSVVSGCLGVMCLAKNKAHMSMMLECVHGVIYFLFVVTAWRLLGFVSLGVGYVFASVIRSGLYVFAMRRMGGFCFTRQLLRHMLVLAMLSGVALCNVCLLEGWVQWVVSGVISVGACVYSYRNVDRLIGITDTVGRIFSKRQ